MYQILKNGAAELVEGAYENKNSGGGGLIGTPLSSLAL